MIYTRKEEQWMLEMQGCPSAAASQEQAWGRLARWGGNNLDLRLLGTKTISTQRLQNFAKSYKNKNLEMITMLVPADVLAVPILV